MRSLVARFFDGSTANLVAKLRRTDGYEAEKLLLELVERLRSHRERRAAWDSGLFELLGNAFCQNVARRRLLLARMLLAYRTEADLQYELAICHGFLVFGLMEGLPDAVNAAVEELSWKEDPHEERLPQADANGVFRRGLAGTLLDAAIYWLYVLLMLTEKDEALNALSSLAVRLGEASDQGDLDAEEPDFFQGLLGMVRLLVQHSAYETAQQHVAICWQVIWRLLRYEPIAEQFCRSGGNIQSFDCALQRLLVRAGLEEQVHVYGSMIELLPRLRALSVTMRPWRRWRCYKKCVSRGIRRSWPRSSGRGACVSHGRTRRKRCCFDVQLGHSHRRHLGLRRGGESSRSGDWTCNSEGCQILWHDDAVCAVGSIEDAEVYRRSACGTFLLAWTSLLQWAHADAEMRLAIEACGACSMASTFRLLAAVAANARDFSSLRLAVGAACSSIRLAWGFGDSVAPASATDVACTLVLTYWPCTEMRRDLCCILLAVTLDRAIVLSTLPLVLHALEELEDWSQLGMDFLHVCERAVQSVPLVALAPSARSVLTKLLRLPVDRRQGLLIAQELFRFAAQLVQSIDNAPGSGVSPVQFANVLCRVFEGIVQALGVPNDTGGAVHEDDGKSVDRGAGNPACEGLTILADVASWLLHLECADPVDFAFCAGPGHGSGRLVDAMEAQPGPEQTRRSEPEFQLQPCGPEFASQLARMVSVQKGMTRKQAEAIFAVAVGLLLSRSGEELPPQSDLVRWVVMQLEREDAPVVQTERALAALALGVVSEATAAILCEPDLVEVLSLFTCGRLSTEASNPDPLLAPLVCLHRALATASSDVGAADVYSHLGLSLQTKLCRYMFAQAKLIVTGFGSAAGAVELVLAHGVLELLAAWVGGCAAMRQALVTEGACSRLASLLAALVERPSEACPHDVAKASRAVHALAGVLGEDSPALLPTQTDVTFATFVQVALRVSFGLDVVCRQLLLSWCCERKLALRALRWGAITDLVSWCDPSGRLPLDDVDSEEPRALRRSVLAFLRQRPRLPSPRQLLQRHGSVRCLIELHVESVDSDRHRMMSCAPTTWSYGGTDFLGGPDTAEDPQEEAEEQRTDDAHEELGVIAGESFRAEEWRANEGRVEADGEAEEVRQYEDHELHEVIARESLSGEEKMLREERAADRQAEAQRHNEAHEELEVVAGEDVYSDEKRGIEARAEDAEEHGHREEHGECEVTVVELLVGEEKETMAESAAGLQDVEGQGEGEAHRESEVAAVRNHGAEKKTSEVTTKDVEGDAQEQRSHEEHGTSNVVFVDLHEDAGEPGFEDAREESEMHEDAEDQAIGEARGKSEVIAADLHDDAEEQSIDEACEESDMIAEVLHEEAEEQNIGELREESVVIAKASPEDVEEQNTGEAREASQVRAEEKRAAVERAENVEQATETTVAELHAAGAGAGWSGGAPDDEAEHHELDGGGSATQSPSHVADSPAAATRPPLPQGWTAAPWPLLPGAVDLGSDDMLHLPSETNRSS